MTVHASIVVRAFNEERHIGALFAGIRNQSVSFDYEVILVDSGSTDRTVEIARQYDVALVQIRPEEFTFGFSLNTGIAVAQGDICVIVSAHCEPVDENWLSGMVAPFDDPAVALVYGKQRGKDTTTFSESQIFAKWFPEMDFDAQSFPFCNNANSAIRRAVWETQAFDESLLGLEDIDWAKRAMAGGHVIHYRAGAGVYHVHDETWGQVYNRYRREALALRKIYKDDRFGVWDFIKLFCMNVVGDCIHAFQQKKLVRNIFSIVQFRFLQFWGTFRAHHGAGEISAEMRRRMYYPKRPSLGGPGTDVDNHPDKHHNNG